jgi:hypothetical protein
MAEDIRSDLEGGRETAINWRHLLKGIKDDYRKEMGIPHGVQKDAIQNGWDARIAESEDEWEFTFRLYNNQTGTFESYITMTDKGTHGLTGHVLSSDEMEGDLHIEERWARFQSLAFTKGDEEDAIGARGQGKFIFIGASRKNLIYYDTLRKDNSYRLGIHGVEGKTKCLVNHWDEEEAKDKLKERFPALSPLDHVGTRVIITSPISELCEILENGTFLEMISDTWWEIIDKYGATINLITNEKEQTAEVPKFIKELPYKDNDEIKIHYRENDDLDVSSKVYRVKRLHVAWRHPEHVSSQNRGIYIQRNGMKVSTMEPPRELPREISDGIYGYIQFDNKLDKLMASAEGVTHYDFDWRKRGAAQVRKYIREQIRDFAYKKLGYGVDPEVRRKREQRKAEKKALSAANKVSEALGIKGSGSGSTGNKKTKKTSTREKQPIRLEMGELNLPNDNLRVNYGENVGGIEVIAVNETNNDIEVQLKMWLFPSEGGHVIKEFLPEVQFNHEKNSTKGPFGPFVLDIKEEEFPPGKYKIRSQLICLEYLDDFEKGDILAEKTKTFFVETDPPERISGMWEDVKGVNLDSTVMGTYDRGEYGGYIYNYNLKHGAYEARSEDEDAVVEYLFRLMAQASIEIDLQNDTPVLFDEDELNDVFLLAESMGHILGKWLHDYYG